MDGYEWSHSHSHSIAGEGSPHPRPLQWREDSSSFHINYNPLILDCARLLVDARRSSLSLFEFWFDLGLYNRFDRRTLRIPVRCCKRLSSLNCVGSVKNAVGVIFTERGRHDNSGYSQSSTVGLASQSDFSHFHLSISDTRHLNRCTTYDKVCFMT